MKKILLILCLILGTLQAQTYYIVLNNDIIEVADSTKVRYSFNACSTTYRQVAGNGVEIKDASGITTVYINKLTNFSTSQQLVDSLNLWQYSCATSTCVTCELVDSGEVIGNFLYLFSNSDTTVIDVSSLIGSDSIWTAASGKVEPIDNLPFNYFVNWGGDSVGMYIDTQIVAGQPFYGTKMQVIDALGYRFTSGVEYNAFFNTWQSVFSAFNPNTFEGNAFIMDTSVAQIATFDAGNVTRSSFAVSKTEIILSVDSVESKINLNGIITPNLATEPIGENGAIYYSTALNKFRVYENGAWRDL